MAHKSEQQSLARRKYVCCRAIIHITERRCGHWLIVKHPWMPDLLDLCTLPLQNQAAQDQEFPLPVTGQQQQNLFATQQQPYWQEQRQEEVLTPAASTGPALSHTPSASHLHRPASYPDPEPGQCNVVMHLPDSHVLCCDTSCLPPLILQQRHWRLEPYFVRLWMLMCSLLKILMVDIGCVVKCCGYHLHFQSVCEWQTVLLSKGYKRNHVNLQRIMTSSSLITSASTPGAW